jgi:hypothetical protein
MWVAELDMTSLWHKIMQFIYITMPFMILATVDLGLDLLGHTKCDT